MTTKYVFAAIFIFSGLAQASAIKKTIQVSEATTSRYDRDGNMTNEANLDATAVILSASAAENGTEVIYKNLRLEVAGRKYKVASASDSSGRAFDIYCELLNPNKPNALGAMDDESLLGGLGSLLTGSTVAEVLHDGKGGYAADVVTYDGSYYVSIQELECSSKQRPSIDF
jgi:hypothetical protein